MSCKALFAMTCVHSHLYVACPQELAQYQRNVIQLTTEVEQLHREKADLVGEVEAHKLTVRPSHVISTNHLSSRPCDC